MSSHITISTVGLMGFGAFGQLIAQHLTPHLPLTVNDPVLDRGRHPQLPGQAIAGSVEDIGRSDLIILAVPVSSLADAIHSLRPHLRPGCTVIDVGSVKIGPIQTMLATLPTTVNIIGSHPLFGPQSARDGIEGHNIALCPVRGQKVLRLVRIFLRRKLRLNVHITTAENHDQEAAVVQGVTHMIAKVLLRMGPLPTTLTTTSFERLMQATEMVRYDAPSLFQAIERENPYAAQVRDRFFKLADEVRRELEDEKPLSAASQMHSDFEWTLSG